MKQAERVENGRRDEISDNNSKDDREHYRSEPASFPSFDAAADAEAQEEDVQARVAAYGRLAAKKVPVPSLPKPRAQKVREGFGRCSSCVCGCVSVCVDFVLKAGCFKFGGPQLVRSW